ncbi:outer membrane protein assembly factor BamB [Massilia psychrophila]|uniref:Outer membrane protein assembly factor BamB n=1 Tax=Massilia psychrophila TaxID=1603353 RepID=A0A2G8T413_9BURK|nr:outer membrane protein assembly factor BamB [Massilia psychrophila]PIL40754.1 outer membrane protein assembly factor BamB [Massilia psychrophila]GGE64605.1 outer membrane protein assembly factor BamB [Massilia psychrophila]
MRITQKLVGVGMLALMAGCSTLNSINPFASKSKGNVPAPLVELKAAMAVRTAWKFDIGKAQDFVFSPALAGTSVLVASGDGSIARVDAASGKQIWRIKADKLLSAGVGTDGTMLAVGAVKGGVMTFDMDGKPLWSAQVSSEVLSAPVVGQGFVVVRSIDNRIVGFDAKTGEKKWTVQRPSPPLTLRNAPGMVIAGKDVIVAQPGGKLLALILATGAPRWEVAVGQSRGATELERVTDIGGTPVVIEGDVCAVSYQGRAGCFDLLTGTARWTKEVSSDVGVAVDQRFVFAADDKGAITAFNRESGASAWKNDKLGYRRLSTPVSYGRAVAVGDYQGFIHFLSREDGAFLARAATDGSAVMATPLVAGSNLIFQTQSGTVTAIAVE